MSKNSIQSTGPEANIGDTGGGSGVGVGVGCDEGSRIWPAVELSSCPTKDIPFSRKRKAVICQVSLSVRLPGFQKGMADLIKALNVAALENFPSAAFGPMIAGICIGSVNPFSYGRGP